MTASEARAELSIAPPERICGLCRRRFTNETSHVATDVHLEAMADQSVREWLALPDFDPVAVAFTKQFARMEFYAGQLDKWCQAMDLPDDAETLLVARRISWCWVKAIGTEAFERRMAYARKVIELEITGEDHASSR